MVEHVADASSLSLSLSFSLSLCVSLSLSLSTKLLWSTQQTRGRSRGMEENKERKRVSVCDGHAWQGHSVIA